VIAHTTDIPAGRRSQTAWATSRRDREERVRTCVPAVDDHLGPPLDQDACDGNIVRGED
jgi:hypothetical protein